MTQPSDEYVKKVGFRGGTIYIYISKVFSAWLGVPCVFSSHHCGARCVQNTRTVSAGLSSLPTPSWAAAATAGEVASEKHPEGFIYIYIHIYIIIYIYVYIYIHIYIYTYMGFMHIHTKNSYVSYVGVLG